MDLHLGVLVHEIADHLELIISSPDTEQEDVVIALLVDLVGHSLSVGARRDRGVAVPKILVDVELRELDGFGFCHSVPPLELSLYDDMDYSNSLV